MRVGTEERIGEAAAAALTPGTEGMDTEGAATGEAEKVGIDSDGAVGAATEGTMPPGIALTRPATACAAAGGA